MNEFKYTYTVFTPTYNRANTLHRMFDSLQQQTFKDFEWLVIDNCSNDNTDEVMAEFTKKASFPLRYIKQDKNQGKHVSFNKGVREAQGKFFLEIYSDDALLPTALERLKFYWDLIPDDQKHKFTGVTGLCQDHFGKLVVDQFPKNILDSDSAELYYRYNIKGEKCGFHRTEVLLKFLSPSAADLLEILPFNKIQSASFNVQDSAHIVPEGIVWFRISQYYKTRFVNEYVRVFYTDHREDRLTLAKPHNTVLGRLVSAFVRFDSSFRKFFFSSPRFFIKDMMAFHYYRFIFNEKFGKQINLRLMPSIRASQSFFEKALLLAMLPFGYGLFLFLYSFRKVSDQ